MFWAIAWCCRLVQLSQNNLIQKIEKTPSVNNTHTTTYKQINNGSGPATQRWVQSQNYVIPKIEKTDHSFTFLGICPPTPPLSQHFALSEK